MLQNEGPLPRSEIMKRTGFPKGTIATSLNDKETFFSKDGLWHLVGKEERQENEKGPAPPIDSDPSAGPMVLRRRTQED